MSKKLVVLCVLVFFCGVAFGFFPTLPRIGNFSVQKEQITHDIDFNGPQIGNGAILACTGGNDGSLLLPNPSNPAAVGFCSGGAPQRIINIWTGDNSSVVTPSGTINANTCSDFSAFTFGLAPGAYVIVAPSGAPDTNISVSGAWTSANFLNLRLCNPTTGNITLGGTISYALYAGRIGV